MCSLCPLRAWAQTQAWGLPDGRLSIERGTSGFETAELLAALQEGDDFQVEAEFERFVSRLLPLSGASPDEADSVRIISTSFHPAHSYVLRGYQVWSDMRVLESDFVLVVRADGKSHLWLGSLWPATAVAGPPADDRNVVAAAGVDLSGRAVVSRWAGARGAGASVEDADGDIRARLEYVIEPSTGEIHTEVQARGETYRFDKGVNLLYHRDAKVHSNLAVTRDVRSLDIFDVRKLEDAVAISQSWSSSDTYYGSSTVGKGTSGTQCAYWLSNGYPFSSSGNRLAPALADVSGNPAYNSYWSSSHCTAATFNPLPCSLNFSCQESYNDGSLFRAQHYHYYADKALAMLRANVLSHVSGAPLSDVAISIDHGSGSCTNPAVFQFWPSQVIMLSTNNCPTDTCDLFHEVGHFLDWLYGGPAGTNCKNGDESLLLSERLPDLMGTLIAQAIAPPSGKTGIVDAYRAADLCFSGYFGLADTHWGTNPAQRRRMHVAGAAGCNSAQSTYGHFTAAGDAMWQAFVEISWNLDCNSGGCSNSQAWGTAIGSGANWNSPQTAARQLLRSIGWAYANSGNFQTVEQFVALVLDDLEARLGSTLAGNALGVFQHHGILD